MFNTKSFYCNSIARNKYKTITTTILTLILLIIVFKAFAQPYRVSGDCMEPAVMDGQRCFLNRISPYLRQCQIGNIIVFKYEGIPWISRVVALENDTIEITDASVVINGIAHNDKKIYRNWAGWNNGTYAINKPHQVPADHVFVLSDNLSAKHDDSRVFGPIPKSSILGIIW